jgi:hypothetical protein
MPVVLSRQTLLVPLYACTAQLMRQYLYFCASKVSKLKRDPTLGAHCDPSIRHHTSAYVSNIRQHASAYVSIRQHVSAYVSMCQHTSAYAFILQHTSAYVRIRQCTSAYLSSIPQHTSAYVSIRQHTTAYVSMRQHTSAYEDCSLARGGWPPGYTSTFSWYMLFNAHLCHHIILLQVVVGLRAQLCTLLEV